MTVIALLLIVAVVLFPILTRYFSQDLWLSITLLVVSVCVIFYTNTISARIDNYWEKELSKKPFREYPKDVVLLRTKGLGTLTAYSDRIEFINKDYEITVLLNKIKHSRISRSQSAVITYIANEKTQYLRLSFNKKIELRSWEIFLKNHINEHSTMRAGDGLKLTLLFAYISVIAQIGLITWSFFR